MKQKFSQTYIYLSMQSIEVSTLLIEILSEASSLTTIFF